MDAARHSEARAKETKQERTNRLGHNAKRSAMIIATETDQQKTEWLNRRREFANQRQEEKISKLKQKGRITKTEEFDVAQSHLGELSDVCEFCSSLNF